MPVEGCGNAFYTLAAGGKETRHHKNDHERAECHRIAQRQPRRRPAGLELARRQQGAFDMRLPERLRHRILTIGGDTVCDRGGRTMRFTGAAIKPAQAVVDARQPQNQQRQCRCCDGDQEYEKTDGARERRQHQPQTGPGKSEEETEPRSPARRAPATAAPTTGCRARGLARARAAASSAAPDREAGRSLRPKAAPSLGLRRICCSPG